MIYDCAQKKSELLVGRDNEQFTSATSYDFSFDKKFILTSRHLVKLFRHSFFALWDVYDIEKKQMMPVTIGGQALAYRLVKFSPVDNSMIVVYNNNLYYKRSPTDIEIQITSDGSMTNGISNGVPDWVFEEEVFASNSATWFSPDGKKIAFIRFDDSKVPVMNLPVYGRPGDPAYQYPQTLPVNYPKVATKNPEVKLFYVDLSTVIDAISVVRHEIPVPERFVNEHTDHLITSVAWANNNDLIAVFMNRVQSKADIRKCTTSGTPACVEAKKLDVDGGWVEFFTAPFFNKEGSNMIYINSVNGYRHVVSLDLNTFVETPRTSGDFVVTEILSFNKDKNVIIFTANTDTDSKVQHVYAVKNEVNASKVCLTCTPSSPYNYFSADVSKDGGNLAITALGPEVPQTHLYSLEVKESISLGNHVELESNKELKKTLENKKLPKVIYDKIVLDNGSESQVMMAVPADLDENAARRYPMLVEVYGGPDSSSVTTKWSLDWGTYLVSTRDIIYVKIDGRGSGLRGDKNLFSLYRKLGTVEVQDQIETAAKLQKKHSYIDSSRSAIWGWSYGGYVSGMSLMSVNSTVYKCAVSVAPGEYWNG
jgi:dipeptidyl-peptidase 4